MTFFRYTPALALLPLYVVWFGYGEASKILLIATNVAVITLLGAHQGVRGVPRVYLDAASSLGAGRWLRFRKIVLPAAFPAIFASVRIAVGLAWVTIVVAELIDARMPSLGYLLATPRLYGVAWDALVTNQYRAGTVSYLEVVVAQATALANQRTAVEIAGRRMAAAVLLVKALGGGWRASELPTAKHDA